MLLDKHTTTELLQPEWACSLACVLWDVVLPASSLVCDHGEEQALVSPSSAGYLDVRCVFSPVLFCENIDVLGTVPLESWERR